MQKKSLPLGMVFVLCILCLSPKVVRVDAANPLTRFFMMNMNNQVTPGSMDSIAGAISSSGETADSARALSLENEVCLDPKQVLDQVSTLQAETQQWKSLHDKKSQELTIVQKDASHLTQVKQDLVQQIAKVQTLMSKNVTDARLEQHNAQIALAKQQGEYHELQRQYEHDIKLKEDLAEQRVQETEILWQKEVELVKTKSLIQIQAAQHGAEQSCNNKVQSKFDEMQLTWDEDESPDDVLQMLRVERVKYKVLQDENQDLREQLAVMEPLLTTLQQQHEEKIKEHLTLIDRQYADKIEAQVQESLLSKIVSVKKESEQQLTKALQFCQEETTSKLEKVKRGNAGQLDQIQKEHNEKVSVLESQVTLLEEAVRNMTKEHEYMAVENTKHQESLNQNIANLVQSLAELKQQHKQDLAEAETATEKRVIAAKDGEILELEKGFAAKQEQAEEDRKAIQQKFEATVEKLKNEKKQVTHEKEKVRILKEALQAKNDDVQYWNEKFHSRSYLNVTHIQQDATQWAGAMSQQAQETSSKAYGFCQERAQETSSKVYRFCQERYGRPLAKALRPMTEPCQTFYRKYLDEHLHPIFEATHQLKQDTQKSISQSWAYSKAYLTGVFDGVVKDIRHSCPTLKKESKDKPQFVQRNIDSLCQQPEAFLSRSMNVTTAIFVIIFHRTIFGWVVRFVSLFLWLVRKCVTWSLQGLWFVCPLRLLPIWNKASTMTVAEEKIKDAQ